MDALDRWTLMKMKSKENCTEGKTHDKTGSSLCRDNVSFKDEDCQECLHKEVRNEF